MAGRLDLPFAVFTASNEEVDAKYRVADDTARDVLITNNQVRIGYVIYHLTDDKRYMLKELPTLGSTIGVVWEEIQSGALDLTPGGNDKALQFNDGGVFNGDDDLAWDKVTKTLSLGEIEFNGGEKIKWNDKEYTIDIETGLGSTIQVGQETLILLYNDTGATINNLEVLLPKAATIVSGHTIPTVRLASSDRWDNAQGTLMVATATIPDGALGFAVKFGRARGGDTSAFAIGDQLYLSTTPGQLTNVRPAFPNYDISLGGVLTSDPTGGEIFVSVTRKISDTINNFWNGTFRESIEVDITVSGSQVFAELSPMNGHPDMTMIFSSGLYTLITTPPTSVELSQGTATVPQFNYLYIPEDTKVLTASTSGFPVGEHIKVGTAYIQTFTEVAADGALKLHTWNDHIQSTIDNQGHLSHITERLRQEGTKWRSGCSTTSDVNGVNNYISCTSGVVYQLHKQIFPAFNTETGDHMHIINDSVTPFVEISDLGTLTLDANGDPIANTAYSLVIWGSVNSGGPAKLFVNLPTGTYSKTTPEQAKNDASNFSNYTIPTEFQGTGFLMARFTYVLSNGVLSLYASESLLGRPANAIGGAAGGTGGSGVTTFLELLDTPGAFTGEAGKHVKVGASEQGLEFEDPLDVSGYSPKTSQIITATVSAGNIDADDEVPANTDLEAFIKQLIAPVLSPTIKTNKSLSVTGVSSTNREVGSTYTATLVPVLNQGLIDSKDGSPDVELIGGINYTEFTGTDINFTSGAISKVVTFGTANQSWTAKTYHYAGAGMYYDSNGTSSSELDIYRVAGFLTRTSSSVAGRYNSFKYVGAINTAPTESIGIRALGGTYITSSSTFTITLNISPGERDLAIYIPEDMTLNDVVHVESNDHSVINNFLDTDIQVADGGGTATGYKEWKAQLGGTGYDDPATYIITVNA